jgi:glycerophosphoryl diester phosphodiesterase
VERIAHRGAKREFPENSIPAFRRAFERGADAIELDVHATRDGVVIVHHDPKLRHASGRLGRPIADLTASELRAEELRPGIAIPTLAQVLEIAPAGRTVYVEIKGSGIEEAVAAALAGTSVRCVVHSFDHGAIARMRSLLPTVPRGILIERSTDGVEASMRAVDARDVWPEWRLIDAALLARVHDAGGRVIAWTVNSRATAAELLAAGVDGLCTDDVRVLAGL